MYRSLVTKVGCWLVLTPAVVLADHHGSEVFEFSGFARVVAGYLDEPDSPFNGYEDSVSLGQQSLVALQPTLNFTSELSATAQWLAHTSDDRGSSLEWLYLSYQPIPSWRLRAGKLRTPFFRYSDGIDVGYTYPWITPPTQVYNNYLFSTFEGGSVSYQHGWPSLALAVEGYYGSFDDDVYIAGSRVDVDAQVSDLMGVVLNLRSHNVNLRLSYHAGYNETDLPQLDLLRLPLEQAGFARSADSLDSKGRITIAQGAISYDSLYTFWEAEWVRTHTEFSLTPELTGYYLMGGAHLGDVSIHLTYAASAYGDVSGESELQPLLLDQSNPLFPLAAGYYQLLDRIPDGSLDSYTLGARWDFRLNMALKAEWSWLQETSPGSGFFSAPREGLFDPSLKPEKQSALLYQLGWEWIF